MNLSIGLSGLRAAQQAIDLVGTNLANAATEGYHKQRILLSPVDMAGQTSRASTGGVRVDGASRAYDVLIEREHLRLQPQLGQIEQELSVLTTLEAVMGNLDGDPMGESLNKFFSSLSALASDPTQSAYAQDVVWSADALCTNFRSMGEFLLQTKEQLLQQAEQYVAEVNGYAQNIAELNREIELALRRGVSPNMLQDQRDQAITKLAELADIQVTALDAQTGQVSVCVWGTPLVVATEYQQLNVGVNSDALLGVAMNDSESYSPYVSGGKIGALAELYNEILPDIQNGLDALAQQIMWQFNNLHAQGTGINGSFSELTGVAIDSALTLGDWQPPVDDGTLSLRLLAPDGSSRVYDLHISSTLTVEDVLDQINLISPGNLSANLADSAVYLESRNGYTFDFLPTYTDTSSAAMETLTGRAVATLSRDYFTGDDAADELVFDLGTTAAEQFTYAVGNDSKTLYEVVQDINTWSESVHSGWQAAQAVWDDSAGGFVLQLHAWDYDGSGHITLTNTGNVKWSGTSDDVSVGAGNFVQGDARAAFGASVQLRGVYTGENQTFTCRVVHPDGAGHSGQVGVEEDLTLEVYNENSELVKVLSIGLGYPAGEPLEILEGVQLLLGTGTLADGDEFTFTARSVSDETMFLAAAGLNTFFKGTGASDLYVRDEFYSDPHRLATGRSVEGGDGVNATAMLNLQNEKMSGLNSLTPYEHYNNVVTTLGQQVLLRESRQEALQAVYRELINQRDQISGVDVNEEAANLLVFERMFQSMSKFIMTQNEMLEALMDIL